MSHARRSLYNPQYQKSVGRGAASMRGKMAKHVISLSLVLALCFVAPSAKPQPLSAKPRANDPIPRYTGQSLVRPENYREWIFLSSGLGMSYNPSANGHEMFT